MRNNQSIAARTAKYLKTSVKLHQEPQRISITAFWKGCTNREEPQVHQELLNQKNRKVNVPVRTHERSRDLKGIVFLACVGTCIFLKFLKCQVTPGPSRSMYG